MTFYSADVLVDKLLRLNNSQPSVETLSRWLIYHQQRAAESVATWKAQFIQSSPDKKLTLLYLANDVMQNSRKKGSEFTDAFATVLEESVSLLYRVADAKTKNSVQRLINIWQERNLFLPGFLARLRGITGQPYVPSTTSSNPTTSAAAVATAPHPSHVHHPSVHVPAPSIMPAYSHTPGQIAMPTHFVPAPVVPAPPPQTPIPSALKGNGVLALFTALEDSSVGDALAEEKINVIRPELLSGDALQKLTDKDKALAEKLRREVDESCAALELFKARMEIDLERRSQLVSLLSDLTERQEDLMNENANKLQKCLENIVSAAEVKQQLSDFLAGKPLATSLHKRTHSAVANSSSSSSSSAGTTETPAKKQKLNNEVEQNEEEEEEEEEDFDVDYGDDEDEDEDDGSDLYNVDNNSIRNGSSVSNGNNGNSHYNPDQSWPSLPLSS